jgi:hypothetical protein
MIQAILLKQIAASPLSVIMYIMLYSRPFRNGRGFTGRVNTKLFSKVLEREEQLSLLRIAMENTSSLIIILLWETMMLWLRERICSGAVP